MKLKTGKQYRKSVKPKVVIWKDQQIDNLLENQVVLYKFEDDRILPVIVTRGLSDMSFVEIKKGVNLGDAFILESKAPRKGR